MTQRHTMIKDIHDQPMAMQLCVEKNLSSSRVLAEKIAAGNVSRICIVGCSTTSYIGIAAKPLFEKFADISVENLSASEYIEYPPPARHSLLVAVSRSGETGDILSAVATAKQRGIDTLAVVEVPESTLAREANDCLYTYAGSEGMVSIKSYTNGIVALYILALQLAGIKQTLATDELDFMFAQIHNFARDSQSILNEAESQINSLAEKYKGLSHVCLLARGPNYATALEGMLMIKEAALTHAEALYGGDLKHGHINVINPHVLVIAIAPPGNGYAGMLKGIKDAKRAGGRVIAFGETGDDKLQELADDYLGLPTKKTAELFSPVYYTIPLQLMAYYLAVKKGIDPDHGPGSEMVGGFYHVGDRIVYSIKKK